MSAGVSGSPAAVLRLAGNRSTMTAPFAVPSAKRYVLRQARVLGRSLLKPEGPLDFDGFAIVDILVDEGAIAKIAPAGRGRFRRRAAASPCPGASCCRSSSTPTPIIDKGHIWRRKRNPVGDFPSALAAAIEDRSANWTAGRRRRADGVQPALGLRARHDGDPHPYRQRRRADAHQLAGLRRGARALARTGSRSRRRRSSASILRSTDAHMADIEAMLDAHGTGHPRRGDLHGPPPARGPRRCCSSSPSARAGSSTSMSTKAPIRRRARSGSIAEMAIERRFPAPHPGRPLLLARAAGGRRTAKDDRRRRARGDQRRLAADVQPVPPGSPSRPHAALARRHRAARTQGAPAST